MDFRAKKVFVSVVSDLVTDQRVHRTALTLREQGAIVTLVGRKMSGSLKMAPRAYRTVRFSLLFEKGPLFYASYNIRLFFFLLFNKCDFLVANDLDTLPANFLIARLKGCPLVYDSHEYFTEVPELTNRPVVRRIWLAIERWILPKLKTIVTVNESIANEYRNRYGIDVKVVRNIPLTNNFEENDFFNPLTRADLKLPENKTIFILQGAGINVQRGAEELVEAMQFVNDALLLIVGGGDVIDDLKKSAIVLNLSGKVIFMDKVPQQKLRRITRIADFGLTLDKDTNLNYRYSLPNKLFDYIHAGLPVIASDLPEIRRIIDGYKIGVIIPSHEPQAIASVLNKVIQDAATNAIWKENLKKAAVELTWDSEREVLLSVFQNAR